MNNEIKTKFFADPDWEKVEDELRLFIEPLVDMNELDWERPPGEFKAELRAKIALYKELSKFLQESGIISRPLAKATNPFK